jgi:thiol-disulfide isomerase/thioredoxin
MKNLMIKFICLTALVFTFNSTFAQLSKVEDTLSVSKKTSLHIGSKVPDKFYNVNNYQEKQINLSSFKGKWILLDLWGVYCASCIEHMPDVEKLQNKFKDSLEVILVTKNTNLQVQKSAKIAENVRNSKLPFVNGPNQLAGLFDFSFVPLYIWINPDGVIKFMTNDQFSMDTVRNILSGRNLEIAEKKTILFKNSDQPIIMNLYPLFGNNYYIYSYLAPQDESKYKFSLGNSTSLNFNGIPKGETGKFSFRSLYIAAYGYNQLENPLPEERVIINFNDTAHYSNSEKRFDYELVVRKNIPEKSVRRYMQSQFDLFFNVVSHIEKRMVPCLVFKRLDNGHNCFTTGTDTITYDRYGDNMLKANIKWKTLFKSINFRDMAPPHTVIDETGIGPDKIVSLNISLDFEHLKKMEQSLEAYGLTIVKENRLMDCIVINDN